MDAVAHFRELMAQGAGRPDLDTGAIAIAAGADPDLDQQRWLHELDTLAEGVDSLDSLVHRIFVAKSFAGDRRTSYDPRNYLLSAVLARRLGIPITLSIVVIEVGRRAGIRIDGVDMPGHFLVRPAGSEVHLDAFHGGRFIDEDQCEELFYSANDIEDTGPFGPHLLATTSTTDILTSILDHLRIVYRDLDLTADLEWVLQMRLALPGAGVSELVELAVAMGHRDRPLDGARFLEDQAALLPQHAEALELAARSLRSGPDHPHPQLDSAVNPWS